MLKLRSIPARGILFAILLLMIAMAGMWVLKISTPYGLALRNDSVQYINGARNLLAGNGYTRTSGAGELKPITTVPPMFSTVIAAASLTGLEALRSARFLILILFGLDILLLGYLTWRLTHSSGFALAGALLFASSNVILSNFSWLMSEPLFVFFWLLIFIIFDVYLDRRQKWLLVAEGVLCGLAYLTRYVGVTLLASLGLLLVIIERNWKDRLRSLFLLVLPYLLLAAGWMIRNYIQIGNPANRSILVHLVTIDKINDGIANFWDWLLPDVLSDFYLQYHTVFQILFYILLVTAMAGLIVALYSTLRSGATRQSTGNQRFIPLAVFIPVYIGLTLFSMSFVDASTILDHRLLIPVYLPALILSMVGLNWVFQQKRFLLKCIPILVILVSVGFSLSQAWTEVNYLSQNGGGYASLELKFSPTMEYIRNLPPIIIYTNKSYMVYIVTGRPAYLTPSPDDPVTNTPRENYRQDLETMLSAIKDKKAILVFFKEKGYAGDPWFLELTRGLTVVKDFYDGVIYQAE